MLPSIAGMAAALPAILQDSAGNSYVYGLDLISRTNGSTQEYHLYDGLGSTTGLANASGGVTASYEYDVFGAVRTKMGTSTNEFTFAGEQVDASGLQYLRARYYDRTTGRFLSRDPWAGSAFEPGSLNRYPYVLNNPINLIDPTGLHCRPWHPHHCSTRDVIGAVSTGVQSADLLPLWGSIPFLSIPATFISIPLDVGALRVCLIRCCGLGVLEQGEARLGLLADANLVFGIGGQLVSAFASPSLAGPPVIAGTTSAFETTVYLSSREKIEKCGKE